MDEWFLFRARRLWLHVVISLGLLHAANMHAAISPAMEQQDFRQVIREAKASVFPTVVFVRVVRDNLQAGQSLRQEAAGSGVLISSTGEVLTNWHVVDKTTEIRCLLQDGRSMHARIVASDKDMDLALLQLELREDEATLPYSHLGDSDLLVEGDFVMAMGAPWGLSRSVSIGIISCQDRYLPDTSAYNLWLQTDASISPGNSGGPLVDTEGEVIGINTLGILWGGDTGFAIPSSVIKEVLPNMREQGEIGWLYGGMELQPLNDFNRNIFFHHTNGVMVASVDPMSPAMEAGLISGDRIVQIDGEPVTAVAEEALPDLRRSLALRNEGEMVLLQVDRGGRLLDVPLSPIKKGEVEGEEMDFPRWDFTLKAINRFDNPDLFFYRPEGVFIYGVKQPGNAAMAGLRPRDILLEIDGKPIATLEDAHTIYEDAMGQLHTRPRLFLTVLRSGTRQQIILNFSRDYQQQ